MHASNKLYAQKMLQKSVSDETVKSVLDNKYSMLNALGIMQHHDAITGTHSQQVDEDYLKMMEKVTDQELDEKIWGSFARNV